jgi:hypothetical protein
MCAFTLILLLQNFEHVLLARRWGCFWFQENAIPKLMVAASRRNSRKKDINFRAYVTIIIPAHLRRKPSSCPSCPTNQARILDWHPHRITHILNDNRARSAYGCR